MKTLNQLINEYTDLLKQGELQKAYKGIIDFINDLRIDLTKRFPEYEMGNLYQGYMDMTYFPMNSKDLKEKGLKIAIVYLHGRGDFEVWLCPRNRNNSTKYKTLLDEMIEKNDTLFHDDNNPDSILESTLILNPNFNDQKMLVNIIGQGVERFLSLVIGFLSQKI
jgi:hypothetical protein